MLSKFPRWTSRVQWEFILVRSKDQRLTKLQVASSFNWSSANSKCHRWDEHPASNGGSLSSVLNENEFNSINLRDQKAEFNRESTVKRPFLRLRAPSSWLPSKVIAEMSIPRPMGVHSHAARVDKLNENHLQTTKRLFPTGIVKKRKNHHALCALQIKVKLVQCFHMQEKVNVKASWVCKRPIMFPSKPSICYDFRCPWREKMMSEMWKFPSKKKALWCHVFKENGSKQFERKNFPA